jgi:hypothetical protein
MTIVAHCFANPRKAQRGYHPVLERNIFPWFAGAFYPRCVGKSLWVFGPHYHRCRLAEPYIWPTKGHVRTWKVFARVMLPHDEDLHRGSGQ